MPTLSVRIAPSLAILFTVSLVMLTVTVPAYFLGRKAENQRHFLKAFRVPAGPEAFLNYCMDYAIDSSQRNDVIFLGDSACLSGIQPSRFQQLTGLAAYNLGTIGMLGMEGRALLLRSYLEHHPAPRVVVLCVLPMELSLPLLVRHVKKSGNDSPERTSTERFLWSYGRPGEYPPPVQPNLVKYYVTQGLLNVLGNLRGGERHYLNTPTPDLNNYSYSGLKDKFRENRGFYCFKDIISLPLEERRDLDTGFFLPADGATADDPYPVSPEVDRGVRKLAGIAAGKDAVLMVRLAPELQSDHAEHFDRISAWFDRLESECPNVVCDRPAVLLYGPQYFSDVFHHLNLRGAEKFTALVATNVMRLLGGKNKLDSKARASNPSVSTSGPKSQ